MTSPRPTSRPLAAAAVRTQVRQEAPKLAVAGAAGVAEVVVSLLEPWPLALAVDGALAPGATPSWMVGHDPVALLASAALGTVLLALLGGALDAVASGTAESAAERVGSALRATALDRVLALSLRWHDRNTSGEILARLTSDVGRVLDALVATVTTLVPDLLLFTGIFVVLLAVDAPLAAVGLAVVPLLAWLSRRQRQRVRAAERLARDEAGQLSGTTAELLRSVRAVQSFGRADVAAGLFGAVNDRLLRARVRAVAVETRWAPVPSVLLALGTGAVLLVGGLQVRDGVLTTGELLVVITYLRDLHNPVRGLVRLAGVRAKATVSRQRLEELLECRETLPQPEEPVRLGTSRLSLCLEGVSFSYSTDRPVLAGVDLTVRPGERVCLLGPSGAGKSTVLHLLLRLYDADRGTVRVGGVDVRTIDPLHLRQRVGYVPQDPWLLSGTLAANIGFGRPGATRDEVLAAGSLAGVDEFAGRLPQGYDTPLGEAGGMLSGGQRRRIAIARAVVAGAPVLLLDEPTASLDDEAAARVVDAIEQSGAGRTVLIVTHDPRLAAIADRVLTVQPMALPRGRRSAPPTAPLAVQPLVSPVRDRWPVASDPDRRAIPVGSSTSEGR